MSNQDGTSQSKAGQSELDALGKKLKAAQTKNAKPEEIETSPMALGLKYATEFSAATLVGTALGFGFDKYVGTAPFGLLIGLMLGVCAGIREIVRSAQREMEKDQVTDL